MTFFSVGVDIVSCGTGKRDPRIDQSGAVSGVFGSGIFGPDGDVREGDTKYP